MSDKEEKRKEDEADREEWTEAERQAEHKLRMRFGFGDLIEDMIQEGQERGVFDNLQGKGKPLNLKGDVYEDERKLAHALMKEHKILPLWLAKHNAVHEAAEALRADIGRHWRRHDQAYRYAQDKGRRSALRLSWDAHCRAWEERIEEINKQIADFNLRRPSEKMEIFTLRLADEIERAGARRALDS